MVVNVMKWRPWPLVPARNFQVKLKLHSLEGFTGLSRKCSGELSKVMVDVKWKGPKGAWGPRFKRSLKRAKTTQKIPEDGPSVTWEEEFEHTCFLTATKNGNFLPWEVCFVINEVNAKSKSVVLGTALMNVAKFVLASENVKKVAKIPVLTYNGNKCQAALIVSIDFVELRTLDSCPLLNNNDELPLETTLGNRLDTTKAFNTSSSPMRELTTDSSRNSLDSNSTFDWDDEEGSDPGDYSLHRYGPLTGVNLVVEGALSCREENGHAENHLSSLCKRGLMELHPKEGEQTGASDLSENGSLSPPVDQSAASSSVRSILSWRKRKFSFRSTTVRGEPLLNKDYGEEGGDDIDFDRRSSGFPIKSPSSQIQVGELPSNVRGCLELDFGDEHFVVGSWERKDLVSRDGHMKLAGDVFFATIDQRSERAGGESACTALVVILATWLHQNPGRMPIKAELDTLIREGSAQWRNLCNKEAYKNAFPDGHFDLETVIRSNIQPLIELPHKSYVGFFQPIGLGDCCHYLQGAMSFESIWEEMVARQEEDREPAIYIVSWNDHFFILKVEDEVCYIIDTLGERLCEGGKQAYMLRFNKDTCLSYVSTSKKLSTNSSTQSSDKPKQARAEGSLQVKELKDSTQEVQGISFPSNNNLENVCSGREACKEFIKDFLADLPLRELETDIKKGLLSTVSLHQRLQIEFHYTSLLSGSE